MPSIIGDLLADQMSKRRSRRPPEPGRETGPRSWLLRSRTREPVTRQRVSAVLIVAGVVIFAQHWVSHIGAFSVISGSADDLIIGYPTAGVLVFTGLMMLPGPDRKRQSQRR